MAVIEFCPIIEVLAAFMLTVGVSEVVKHECDNASPFRNIVIEFDYFFKYKVTTLVSCIDISPCTKQFGSAFQFSLS